MNGTGNGWALRARQALGIIRLMNGTAALVAPRRMVRTFGVDGQTGPTIYALRLFGVRTVILGIQLLVAKGDALDDALHYAVPIHASDTSAAILAGFTGQLPRRAAFIGAVMSSANTLLALAANAAAPSQSEVVRERSARRRASSALEATPSLA